MTLFQDEASVLKSKKHQSAIFQVWRRASVEATSHGRSVFAMCRHFGRRRVNWLLSSCTWSSRKRDRQLFFFATIRRKWFSRRHYRWSGPRPGFHTEKLLPLSKNWNPNDLLLEPYPGGKIVFEFTSKGTSSFRIIPKSSIIKRRFSSGEEEDRVHVIITEVSRNRIAYKKKRACDTKFHPLVPVFQIKPIPRVGKLEHHMTSFIEQQNRLL